MFHLGPLGRGATAKIAHNLIVYVNFLACAEGMKLAEESGIDLQTFTDLVHVSGGQSRATDNWIRRNERRSAGGGNLATLPYIIYKDLHHALELGHKLNVRLPGAALAQQMIDEII
jgi:3-hydroxyisobutyrate dehydrogenase